MKLQRAVKVFASGLALGITLYGVAAAEDVPATIPPEINMHDMDVIAPEEIKPNELPGQSETILPGDLFGSRKGYFHPFLSITGKYSDNIFRDKDDTISDWSAVFSPGIWVAVPGSDKIILSVSSSTAEPGGLSMFLEKPEAFSRYQAYAFYGADVEKFLDHTERDNTKQTANAFFQYNLRGGLSFNIYDKWIDSEDPLRFRNTLAYDKYMSNMIGIITDYDVTEKVNLRLDLNNYYLKYDEDFNYFKDRTDNGFSFYGFYAYTPKTSFFGEYSLMDVNHDQATSPDSLQQSLYGGIRWNPTDATKLMAKAGGSNKNFAEDNAEDISELSFELQGSHAFTAKTSVTLFGAHKLNETKVPGTQYQVMSALTATYNQQFTTKLSGTLTLGITENDYQSNNGTGNSRDDMVYDIEPGLQYMFKEWLMVRSWYAYTKRDSSDDYFDYDENAFYLSLSGGM